MPTSSTPRSNYDQQLALANAARNPSTQPSTAGMSDADNRMLLDFAFPFLALIPGGTQDFTKQVFSGILPAISGAMGFVEGGPDRARAEWNAQSQAQDDFEKQNEGASAIADLATPIPSKVEAGVDLAKAAGSVIAKAVPAIAGRIADASQIATGLKNIDDWIGKGRDVAQIWDSYRNGSSSTPQRDSADAIANGAGGPFLDHFGVLGNPNFRPEIFGDDGSSSFLPQSMPEFATAVGSNDMDAGPQSSVDLNPLNYPAPSWGGDVGPKYYGEVNIDPQTYGGPPVS